ncbi:mycofactocin biosynthesis chaperone MftB [Georgenia alba]|uniref:Mycofactocin biosynthesis chaperone MftB n=1 Tax=Georgenia alba TaxID=2233858 RepID=A0ABW2QAX6_9MICO
MRGLLIAPAPALFDPDRPWELHPQVAVRPEPFGALLYHFGTRKLSFLKDRTLLEVVRSLGAQPSVRAAVEAAGVAPEATATYIRAVSTLAASQMVVERDDVETAAGQRCRKVREGLRPAVLNPAPSRRSRAESSVRVPALRGMSRTER